MSINVVNLVFHSTVFAISFFAAFYEYFYVSFGHQGFPGKFRFLTFWNICFQTVYFGLCVIIDLTGAKPKTVNPSQRGSLQKYRDVFHACVIFPTGVFVFASFWGIYAVDRELVHPKAADAFFPVWLNHLVHTTVFPFILIEKLLSHQHYPKRWRGLLGVFMVGVIYTSIVLLVAYFDNYWVYPVLRVLSWPMRAAFIMASFIADSILYLTGEWLTAFIWDRGSRSSKRTPKTFKGV